jgi:hypothetical protein
MAYIGAVAPGYDPTRASVPQLDAERFNGDASTTAFTLTRQVVSPTDINVIVENVLQEPTVAYSVSGYTLNFTEAPPTGTNNIYVIYRGSGISNYAFVPDGSITFAKLANNIKQFNVDNFTANGTGSTVELTEAPASANAVIVSVDGVIQTAPTNYTLSGSTITFTGVPDNGANVVVKHIGFRTTSTVTALQAGSVTATELADSSVTNAKIVSVANTKITGLVTASQIATVANTQITGVITASQLVSPGVNVQVLASGTGTYTVPTGTRYLMVEMVGGGGGGECSDSAGGPAAGGTGGTTTFGTSLLTATGGAGGSYNGSNAGGTATLSSPAVGFSATGGQGASPGVGYPGPAYMSGGSGASSPFGGNGRGGWGTATGGAASTNTGSGGGGGGANTGTVAIPGGGGGAGAYIKAYITSPSATYSYAVGAAGTGASAGANGYAGGAGGSGVVIVTAYF